MHIVGRKQLELLRKQYPEGTEVCLEYMEGESRMTPGLKGKVCCVDDAGQIHVNWQNGSSLAVIPGVDRVWAVRRPVEKDRAERGRAGDSCR
jgi:DNA/RNA-binding domain of Phe-tRNA-synthetase-like protein